MMKKSVKIYMGLEGRWRFYIWSKGFMKAAGAIAVRCGPVRAG